MREFYNIISPFIAAFLASFLTYYFTVRTKKHEALIAQRLPAFKAIQKKLVSIQRYCEAKRAELDGDEFSSRLNDLSSEDQKSALEHLTELKMIADENQVFLSKSSKKSIERIYSALALLCSMELSTIEHPDEFALGPGAYSLPLERIEESVQKLYGELKLPR